MSPRPTAEDAHSPTSSAPPSVEFQQQWQTGQQPDLDSFLSQRPGISLQELGAVTRIDLRQRRRRGEQPAASDYLTRFPQLQSDPELAIDLIYAEYLVRDELGEQGHLSQLQCQFPMYSSELATQVDLHRALADEDWKERAPGNEADTQPPQETLGPVAKQRTRLPSLGPDYEVLAEIGRGGMGVVYRARQVGLNRLVALKMVRGAEFASDEVLARFRTEAEAVARLHHPQIVQIFDFGEHDGLPYLALELVEGGTLAAQLNGTPWPAKRAATLIEKLARAADFAHERGVIHRDLKPANVLVVADDADLQVKITDFGLAKAFRENASEHTQSGALLGTPSYMAPEQAAGNVKQIGPTADVYALGAILYELLTGRPPFRGETPMATLQQLLTSDPPSIRFLAPGVPRDLATICSKCLRREPEQRYRSAAELGDDLGRWLADQPIQARPTSSAERAWRWCRRNPAPALLGGTVALLLLILAAVYSSSPAPLSVSQDEAQAQDLKLRWSDLDSHVQAEVTTGAWSQLPQALYPPLGNVRSVDISPDGRLLAVCRTEGLEFWDLKTERYWVEPAIAASKIKFTLNGDLIVSSVHSITRWPRQIQSRKVLPRPMQPAGAEKVEPELEVSYGPPQQLSGPTDLAWFAIDPSGDRLLMTPVYYGCRVIDINQPADVVRLKKKAETHRMAISNDRNWAVLTNRSVTGATAFNAITGERAAELDVAADALPLFSPDNRWLAASSGGVQVWRVSDWQLITDLRVTIRARNGHEIAFSPDSRTLAIGQSGGVIQLTDPATGEDWLRLTDPNQSPATFLAFSSDQSQLVAVASGERAAPRIWNLDAIRHKLALRGLDWPTIVPTKSSAEAIDDSTQLEVTFDLGNFRQKAVAWDLVFKARGIREFEPSHKILEQAIEADPECGRAHNDLAWEVALRPEGQPYLNRAVEHARRAVALEPGDQAFLNTLGRVLHRNAQYDEAIRVLERALVLCGEDDHMGPLTELFLALAHAGKGDTKTAQDYYTKVKAWYVTRGGIPPAYRDEVDRVFGELPAATRP